jgi:flavin-dependent dehydrogenase
VDIRTGVIVKRIVPQGDCWLVTYLKSDVVQTVKARFIVAADGANSLVRKQILPEYGTPEKYISVQQWFNIDCDMPYYTGLFDSSITDYYAWTIQKGKQLIFGAALAYEPSKASEVMKQFGALKQKASHYLNLDLDVPVKTESAFISRTTSLRGLRFAAQIKMKSGNLLGMALIGEAAGATSPTSAEGFSYAFKTSLGLFNALESGLDHVELRYDLSCDSIRANLLSKQMKSPGMYVPRLRNTIMRSGIGALRGAQKTTPYKASDHTCEQSPSFHTASSHGH